MPSVYHILPDKALIIGRFAGPTGAEDIQQLLHEVRADPLFDRAFHMLMDFSAAVLRIGVSEVMLLCDFVLSIAEGVTGRTAIIASGPIATALAMIFSKGTSLIAPSAVFSTWDAALKFLGVDLPEYPQASSGSAER